MSKSTEEWGSRIGIILVVASGAIGLGNFLRFPGQAAKFGGGAFMVPYIISFLILGIPVCLSEWIMGRMGGKHGHSSPNIFRNYLSGIPLRFTSAIALIIPIMIYTYYVFIEAWCLAYAVDFVTGSINLHPQHTLAVSSNEALIQTSSEHFNTLTGSTANGASFESNIVYYVLACYAMNFFLVYRGIAKGLEAFAKIAVPVLLICAFIILGKVLSLDNISSGLGRMWNPDWSALLKGEVWIAAAGQIFFSLSVGFGIVLTLSSYLKDKDDVVLSGLSAASLNEFVEVVFGGLITIPVGFLFLGASVVSFGTFGMGFVALPAIFSQMHGGQFFGAVWFFILFMAALTSSVTMIQPGITFLEEGFHLKRKQSTPILFIFTLAITLTIVYFNKNLAALDHTDFWIGTFLIYILATIQILIYGWKIGTKEARMDGMKGALISLPPGFDFVIKYITPSFLLIIFAAFVLSEDGLMNSFNKMSETYMLTKVSATLTAEDAINQAKVARGVFIGIISIFLFFLFLVNLSLKNRVEESK
ncbi:MAG: sodium-dependent transporter [Leptospiraceae bacterium]|nr:sodium-dependent transporter [Leptospiraceae bacterium]